MTLLLCLSAFRLGVLGALVLIAIVAGLVACWLEFRHAREP